MSDMDISVNAGPHVCRPIFAQMCSCGRFFPLGESMPESATASIRCSLELLDQLKEWSEPVSVRAEEVNGEWTLAFRKVPPDE